MSDESWLNEYVLNETGKIWVGSTFWNNGRAWNFGQFGKVCLEAAVYLLDNSYLRSQPKAYGNATLVCRALSAMVGCVKCICHSFSLKTQKKKKKIN